ncbi:MAG: DUF1236 domain-containing protein [Xanthobacteraceae bacterium]|nr:DUF1236 domain-containing protein [Xanthobacteraceae bacterium]
MKAWWLTAAVVAALASVLTAVQAQQGQVPESDTTQFLSPEPMQPRSVPTQTFRRPGEQPREVEQATPQPVPKQAARKRTRTVTTGQATRPTSSVSRRARRAPSANLRGRAMSQYAQARTAARRAALGAAIVMPTEPQRASLSAGFDAYITRMNIWSRAPWEFPATVGGLVPGWVQVYGVPSEIVAIYPALAGNEFLLVGDDVVILEPGTRRIVAMLSRTSGAYVAERAAPPVTAVPTTTGVAPPEDRIRLSRAQIAAIRTVLRQRECRYGRRANFLIGDPVPGTALLCDFPERVIAAVPDIEGYRFITRGNAVVVVDPVSGQVVSVVR